MNALIPNCTVCKKECQYTWVTIGENTYCDACYAYWYHSKNLRWTEDQALHISMGDVPLGLARGDYIWTKRTSQRANQEIKHPTLLTDPMMKFLIAPINCIIDDGTRTHDELIRNEKPTEATLRYYEATIPAYEERKAQMEQSTTRLINGLTETLEQSSTTLSQFT